MNVALLTLPFALALAPEPGYSATHGVEGPAYQLWVTNLPAGFRPNFLNVHVLADKPRFSAVAVHDTRAWVARHDLSEPDYQREYDKQAAAGFRPVSVCGYTIGGAVRYAAVWVLGGPGHWSARHGIPAPRYQGEFDAARGRKELPAAVAGYATPGGHRFAAVYLPDDGEAAEARHDLSAADYQKLFDTLGKTGYWPYCTAAYNTEAGVRFSAVFLKNPGVQYGAKHGLTAAEYQTEFDARRKAGFRPWSVCGYADGGASRFAAVWVRDAPPVSGPAVPKLKAFDDVMLGILSKRGWTGGSLAVSHNGRTVFARGYGFRDPGHRQPVTPATPFRIASITKPFTATVVRQMIAEGKFKPDDRAFGLLGLTPAPTGDARLADVTVDMLLAHRGGWDRDVAKYDPMFDPLAIAKSLGRPAPAKAGDVVEFMLGKPLQHKPGTVTSYSNFGYCVLGRVVEKKSGRTFTQELTRRVGAPLGMTTLALGHTRPGGRSSAEPEYVAADGPAVNVFDPTGPKVAWPDGGFHLEAMDSHGGLISSAPDLLKFARAYAIDGRPRTAGASGTHTGALPGTFTVLSWRAGNTQVAALFNHRGGDADEKAVLDELFAAVDGVTNWP